jgi:hypothetical protein
MRLGSISSQVTFTAASCSALVMYFCWSIEAST